MLDHRFTVVTAFLLLFVNTHASSSIADDRLQSQQFFNSFCISCHGIEKSKGDLRLDQIDVRQWNDPSLLNDIHKAIESGEMPPEDAPKLPEPDQLKALQNVLRNQLHLLAEKQKPGMLKRLSRVEYQNTVNDVFGTDFSLLDRLPLDNIEAGFNNNADNLHMSVFDMESYFNTANLIAENVVSDEPAPHVIVYSTKNTDIDTHSHKDKPTGLPRRCPCLHDPWFLRLSPSKLKSIHRSKRAVFIELFQRGFTFSPSMLQEAGLKNDCLPSRIFQNLMPTTRRQPTTR